LTLSTLAKDVVLPPSTTHRLLTTLQQQRFVRFDPASMSWQIGVQAFVVGNAFMRTRDIVAVARPHMHRLMEESGETTNLYIINGGEAICMAQVQSRQTVRAISRPGGRLALHLSAAGKAMLSHAPRSEVAEIIAKHGMPRATPNTIVSLRKFQTELVRIRARGYSIDNEEGSLGLRCIAASILDDRGVAHAAISVAAPTARMPDARLARLGPLVATAARSVTIEFSGAAGLTPSSRKPVGGKANA
jgi:IclR family acetate operon transcriptional repressor